MGAYKQQHKETNMLLIIIKIVVSLAVIKAAVEAGIA